MQETVNYMPLYILAAFSLGCMFTLTTVWFALK